MTWQELLQSAGSCTRCDLYERATATVFGENKTNAAMVLVGEQPGDQEDKQGRPFVGPAGRVLDRALGDSGIDRADVYLTRFRVGEHKGNVEEAEVGRWRGLVVGTIHPSAVLRAEDQGAREAAYAGFVADLGTAREACQGAS